MWSMLKIKIEMICFTFIMLLLSLFTTEKALVSIILMVGLYAIDSLATKELR